MDGLSIIREKVYRGGAPESTPAWARKRTNIAATMGKIVPLPERGAAHSAGPAVRKSTGLFRGLCDKY